MSAANSSAANSGYICYTCGKSFKSEYILNEHKEKNHMVIKNLKCDQCYKLFGTKKSLSNHIRRHTAKKYDCVTCGKHFISKVLLTVHIEEHNKFIHEGVNLLTCNRCNIEFFSFKDMINHNKYYHSK